MSRGHPHGPPTTAPRFASSSLIPRRLSFQDFEVEKEKKTLHPSFFPPFTRDDNLLPNSSPNFHNGSMIIFFKNRQDRDDCTPLFFFFSLSRFPASTEHSAVYTDPISLARVVGTHGSGNSVADPRTQAAALDESRQEEDGAKKHDGLGGCLVWRGGSRCRGEGVVMAGDTPFLAARHADLTSTRARKRATRANENEPNERTDVERKPGEEGTQPP